MFGQRTLLAVLAISLPYVSAHGWVKRVDVVAPDGTLRSSTVGPVPNSNDGPSIVRKINSVSPVLDLDSPDMNCGPGAQPAALVADVQTGDTIKFAWASGEGGEWPHNTGPVIDYITSCGPAGCAEFNSFAADWFKVQQQERRPDGRWVQENIFDKPGTLDMVVPDYLPAGEYLIRHEIIGLHVLGRDNNAEFYPSCIGIRIQPSADNAAIVSLPDISQSARFPGGYSRQDLGLNKDTYPNAFDPNVPYPFPGPAPLTAQSAIGDGNNDDTSSTFPSASEPGSATETSSTASAPDASATFVPCGFTAQAKVEVPSKRALFRRESFKRFRDWASRRSDAAKRNDEERPFVLSRVMRNLT